MKTPLHSQDHRFGTVSRGVAKLLFALGLVSIALPGNAEPGQQYPPNSVLLLVAPWCAPCHGELARLSEIIAAARPRAVRVMLIEDGARARAMVRNVPPERRWNPPADEWHRARADLLSRAPGLPWSVATDSLGQVCASHGGGLDTRQVSLLLERCRD